MLGAGTSGDRGELRPPAPHARPRTDVTRHGTSVLRVRAPAPGTTCVLSGGAACAMRRCQGRSDRCGRRTAPSAADAARFHSISISEMYHNILAQAMRERAVTLYCQSYYVPQMYAFASVPTDDDVSALVHLPSWP